MDGRLASAILALFGGLASGCFTTAFRGGATVPPVASFVTPSIAVQAVQAGSSLGLSVDERFADRVAHATVGALAATRVADLVVDEREVARADVAPTFLLRYRLVGFSDASTEGGGGRTAVVTLCALVVVPCLLLGTTPAFHLELDATWELEVFDVRGVPTQAFRDARTGEVTRGFDVTAMRPLVARTYRVDLVGGISANDYRTEERRVQTFEWAARELANRLVARSLVDVVATLEVATRSVPHEGAQALAMPSPARP